MKKLINKIKKVFKKPSYNEDEVLKIFITPPYNEDEVLELIQIEALSFSPDLIDGDQKHESRIPYRNGFIDLSFRIKVYIEDRYLSVYEDPVDELVYEVLIVDFDVKLYDQDGHEILHQIDDNLIEKALAPIENY